MAKNGFTSTPCPGCGERNERKKDSVCPDCIGLLETARSHKKQYQEMKANEDIMIECQVPFGWDGPRFSTFRTNQHNKDLEPLGKTLIKLSQLVSVPLGKRVSWGYMNYLENKPQCSMDDGAASGYDLPVAFLEKKKPGQKNKWEWQGKAVMPKEIYDCLCELNNAIDAAIKGTEKGAVEYGKNALLMLNDGHLTMEEFNKT